MRLDSMQRGAQSVIGELFRAEESWKAADESDCKHAIFGGTGRRLRTAASAPPSQLRSGGLTDLAGDGGFAFQPSVREKAPAVAACGSSLKTTAPQAIPRFEEELLSCEEDRRNQREDCRAAIFDSLRRLRNREPIPTVAVGGVSSSAVSAPLADAGETDQLGLASLVTLPATWGTEAPRNVEAPTQRRRLRGAGAAPSRDSQLLGGRLRKSPSEKILALQQQARRSRGAGVPPPKSQLLGGTFQPPRQLKIPSLAQAGPEHRSAVPNRTAGGKPDQIEAQPPSGTTSVLQTLSPTGVGSPSVGAAPEGTAKPSTARSAEVLLTARQKERGGPSPSADDAKRWAELPAPEGPCHLGRNGSPIPGRCVGQTRGPSTIASTPRCATSRRSPRGCSSTASTSEAGTAVTPVVSGASTPRTPGPAAAGASSGVAEGLGSFRLRRYSSGGACGGGCGGCGSAYSAAEGCGAFGGTNTAPLTPRRGAGMACGGSVSFGPPPEQRHAAGGNTWRSLAELLRRQTLAADELAAIDGFCYEAEAAEQALADRWQAEREKEEAVCAVSCPLRPSRRLICLRHMERCSARIQDYSMATKLKEEASRLEVEERARNAALRERRWARLDQDLKKKQQLGEVQLAENLYQRLWQRIYDGELPWPV